MRLVESPTEVAQSGCYWAQLLSRREGRSQTGGVLFVGTKVLCGVVSCGGTIVGVCVREGERRVKGVGRCLELRFLGDTTLYLLDRRGLYCERTEHLCPLLGDATKLKTVSQMVKI